MQNIPKNNKEGQFCYDDEIDLRDIFRILADHKKIFFGITVSCLFLATVYIVVATPLYEIKMQIKPGLKGWAKADIVSWLHEKQYVNLFPDPDKKTLKMLSTLKYKDDRKATIVTLSLYWPDPKDGKTFMNEFTARWTNYYPKKFPNENIVLAKKNLEQEIDELEQQLKNMDKIGIMKLKNRIAEKIRLIDLKRNDIEITKKEIEKQKDLLKYFEETLKNIMMYTKALIKSRDKLTLTGKKQDISVLFLLNSIQQNIAYADHIKSRLVDIRTNILWKQNQISVLKNDIEEIQNAIAELKLKMNIEFEGERTNLTKQIKDLQYQLDHVSPIRIIGPATSTTVPVKPNKALILSLALLCGTVVGLIGVIIISTYKRK